MKPFYFVILLFFPSLSFSQVIYNPSFELSQVDSSKEYTRLTPMTAHLNSWVVNTGSIDLVSFYWQAQDGKYSIDLNGLEAGSISQSFPTEIDSTYHVQFYMSANTGGGGKVRRLRVSAGEDSAVFGVKIEGISKEAMQWKQQLFTFKANSLLTTLSFESLEDDNPYGPAIDNVSLVKLDCQGHVNGTAIRDSFGMCREPDDPLFNARVRGGHSRETFTPEVDVNFGSKFSLDEVLSIENFSIYNRWGNRVFSNQGSQFNYEGFWWDGNFDGKPCPAGTYFYILKASLLNGETESFEGSFVLIRTQKKSAN